MTDEPVMDSAAGGNLESASKISAALTRGTQNGVIAHYFRALAAAEQRDAHGWAQLASALETLRCPRDLIEAAQESQQDAFEHAAQMQSLAALYEADDPRRQLAHTAHFAADEPHVSRAFDAAQTQTLDLFTVALDNAQQGCVGRSFTLLLRRYQAQHASDAQVRAAMARIAADEERQVELVWEIHEWAMSQLSPMRHRTIAEAQQSALDELEERWSERPSALMCSAAGLPDADALDALLDQLCESLGQHAQVA